jgi:hypothetical protein
VKRDGEVLVAMTGKASSAKAATGDKPVAAYIATLPEPQRGIAERVDALATETLPGLERAVKWGMAYYGVDGGWCFSSGAFVGHLKAMFIRGTLADLDEGQLAEWMRQAATMPFFGGKK